MPFPKKRLRILVILAVLAGAAPLLAWRYEYRVHSTFLANDPYYVLDSIAGHEHKPNTTRQIDWPEHPAGAFAMRTNNLGFREDTDTEPGLPQHRILVTGDSHTDGVCANHESWPNLLQVALNSLIDSRQPTEVLNGGTGFYTFQQYEGFLRKHGHLADTWIVTVYTGNDFIETLLYDSTATNFGPAIQTFGYRMAKKWSGTGAVGGTQSANQELFFKLYPEKKAVALSLAMQRLQQLKEAADKAQANLLIAFLPSEAQVDSTAEAELRAAIELPSNTALAATELQQLLADWLQKQQIPVIPLDTALRANNGSSYFWQTDSHLNTEGHALVAEAMFAYLAFGRE